MKKKTYIVSKTVSGTLADCQVIWKGIQEPFPQAIRLDTRFMKRRKRNKQGDTIIRWPGSGKLVFHYNDSVLRRIMLESKESGKEISFDMQVTNDDPYSQVGRQTILLKGCRIETGVLARFDAEEAVLLDEMEFTFQDFEILEQFQSQD